VAVIQEAYINGVSTRKVERLVTQPGLAGMSRSAVSRLCAGLDEQVKLLRERPLEGRYPYLWLDAKVERVREPGGVRHKALVIAYGVHETGRREVIGIDVGEAETEAFWRELLRSLRSRGLAGVALCVSDAHEGLRAAIAKVRFPALISSDLLLRHPGDAGRGGGVDRGVGLREMMHHYHALSRSEAAALRRACSGLR
jgi:putative transposase